MTASNRRPVEPAIDPVLEPAAEGRRHADRGEGGNHHGRLGIAAQVAEALADEHHDHRVAPHKKCGQQAVGKAPAQEPVGVIEVVLFDGESRRDGDDCHEPARRDAEEELVIERGGDKRAHHEHRERHRCEGHPAQLARSAVLCPAEAKDDSGGGPYQHHMQHNQRDGPRHLERSRQAADCEGVMDDSEGLVVPTVGFEQVQQDGGGAADHRRPGRNSPAWAVPPTPWGHQEDKRQDHEPRDEGEVPNNGHEISGGDRTAAGNRAVRRIPVDDTRRRERDREQKKEPARGMPGTPNHERRAHRGCAQDWGDPEETRSAHLGEIVPAHLRQPVVNQRHHTDERNHHEPPGDRHDEGKGREPPGNRGRHRGIVALSRRIGVRATPETKSGDCTHDPSSWPAQASKDGEFRRTPALGVVP